MGWVQTLADAAINGIPGSIDRQSREADVAAKQQRLNQSDLEMHQHLIDSGALTVVGGMVKRPMYNPGNPALGVPPTAGVVLDKADPSRVVTYKPRGGGDAAQYELPSIEEQHGRQIWQAFQDANNPATAQTAQTLAQREADAAQAKAGGISAGNELGRQTALNDARQQYGVALPQGSGAAAGTKVLPEELAGVAGGAAAAEELPQQIQQRKVALASQQLGATTTPEAWKIRYDMQPEDVKPYFDRPEAFEPGKSQIRANIAGMTNPQDRAKYTQMMNMTPKDWNDMIDGVAPPSGDTAKENQRLKTLVGTYLRALPGTEGMDKAIATIEKTKEQLGSGENSVRTELAKVPGEIQKAVAVADAVNKGNGNGALSGVAPHLVAPATAAKQKADDEFTGSQQAMDDVNTFIKDARAGNKIGYAYAPVEGVLTLNSGRGIKRVNMAEIESYGGAGSLADKLRGWLGKQTTGASIPPDILSDMEQLHSQVAANAGKAYQRKLDSINHNYGSSFKPEAGPAPQAAEQGIPTPKTQREYDTLPKGANFMKPGDSKVYVKR